MDVETSVRPPGLRPQLGRSPLPGGGLTVSRLRSPVGEILAATDVRGAVRAIDFTDYEQRLIRLVRRHYGPAAVGEGPPPSDLAAALDDYFSDDMSGPARLPLAAHGSPFQHRVWHALLELPPGRTASYGWLAARINAPAAVRAVGLANGANPIAIAVPCHRVVGASGSLTGYGGGLPRKDWLLRHEGVRPGAPPELRPPAAPRE